MRLYLRSTVFFLLNNFSIVIFSIVISFHERSSYNKWVKLDVDLSILFLSKDHGKVWISSHLGM